MGVGKVRTKTEIESAVDDAVGNEGGDVAWAVRHKVAGAVDDGVVSWVEVLNELRNVLRVIFQVGVLNEGGSACGVGQAGADGGAFP